jgi:chromosome segregation ATPase
MTDNLTPEAVAEPTCLISQAKGRAAFLRDRGEVKTPDLLEALAAKLAEAERDRDDLHDALKTRAQTPGVQRLLRRAFVRAEAAEAKLAEVEAERDEATNQLDSARHSVDVLEKRVAGFAIRAALQPKETDHE